MPKSNKLTKFVGSYFTRRDKLTAGEWRKIRATLRETQNDIISKIKSYDLPEWQMTNMNQILVNINASIQKFDAIYDVQLLAGMQTMGQFEAANADFAARLSGLQLPALSAESTVIVEQIYPVSKALAQFYVGNLQKITTAEITNGIATGLSTNEVARNIHDKFGLDTRQRELLENRKIKLEKEYRKGNLSKEEWTKKTKAIDKKLRSGSNMSFAQCERISKREMLRSTSFVRQERHMEIFEINPEATKTWVNSHKPGARETHLAAESRYTANPIPVNEVYEVDGETGQMPRDFSFSPKNTEWCACTSFLVTPESIEDIRESIKNQ